MMHEFVHLNDFIPQGKQAVLECRRARCVPALRRIGLTLDLRQALGVVDDLRHAVATALRILSSPRDCAYRRGSRARPLKACGFGFGL